MVNKEKKKEAREALREMERQAKADQLQLKVEQRQSKLEEREKYPTAALRRKARRLRWKQERLARRQTLKDHYKDAPWIVRIPRLYLVKPFIALLIIAALGFGAYKAVLGLFFETMDASKNAPVSQEKIEELSPIDKDGAKRIDATAPVDKDDTWTICVYMVGSNLEDRDENDLSAVVRQQIAGEQAEQAQAGQMKRMKRLDAFTDDLEGNDLELPAYLYYPVKPKPPEKGEGEEQDPGNIIADGPGAASTDIGEMTAEKWSDNISIVVQPGGATRWSNPIVNPNRTQRFLYKNGEFKEVYDQPLQRIADPKSLTSFLTFCKEEYPADHTMLVLWDHGGASFGYGMDSIYGGMMSLQDVREGLEGAFKPDMKDPPFDIIGFDACLMSSVEVTHALEGFASYYALSEESEPGEGWDYTPWLKAMTEDPTMSPAQIARKIADSYMDFYMTQNVNMGWLISNDVTFAVLDAAKAEKLYDAWCDLSKKLITDAAKDQSVLAEIGRCSDKSIHMPSSVYNLYNTIDLGNYVDHMVDSYPAESSRIKKLIEETVMYHRENGSLSETQGINVYVPGSVEDYSGLMMCLEYIYEICDDPATQALYYYKISGGLNEDMQKYLATLTDEKVRTLDLKPFRQFASEVPVTTDTGFELPVSEDLQSMLQSYQLEAAFYDQEGGKLINYGKDELVRLDGEGKMDCEFDGTWICLDGVPLATEVVAATESAVEYRSPIMYNGHNAYLSYAWDRDEEAFVINGVKEAGGGILNPSVNPDPFNYLINTRMTTDLEPGDRVTPVYEVTPLDEENDDTNDSETKGKVIKIKKNSTIKSEKLQDGYYLNSAVIGDFRGDVYYSQVVGNTLSGGNVKERKVDPAFFGRDYD